MTTENIEYNGQFFSCQTIIDISAMINLLRLLSKKQQYLEEKINFQEERLNDKDKRISELEILVKGFSSNKEEKLPQVKQVPFIKKEINKDFDLDEFLINDDNALRKTIYLNQNKDDNNVNKNVEKGKEKSGEKVEKNPEENTEIKKVEIKEEKPEEKKEEKPEDKKEEKPEKNKEIKKDEDTKNETKKEETEKKIDINLLETRSPTLIKLNNLVETENKQITSPEKTKKKTTKS